MSLCGSKNQNHARRPLRVAQELRLSPAGRRLLVRVERHTHDSVIERHFVPTPPTSWGPPRRSVVCPRGGPDPPSGRSLSRRREV